VSSRLGDYDAQAIRKKLAERDESGSVISAKDIAEATGLSLEEVNAHIDQLRAERAFRAAAKPKNSTAIVASAVTVIVAACGLYLWNFARSQEAPPNPAANARKNDIRFYGTVSTRPSNISSMQEVVVSFGPGTPPPAIRVQVSGRSTSFTGETFFDPNRSHHKLSYAAQAAQLRTSVYILADRLLQRRDRDGPAKAGTKFMDTNSNVFEPKFDELHFAIGGDCTAVDGFLKISDLRTGKAPVDQIVSRALASHRSEVGSPDEALPPPGYSIMVQGRQVLSLYGSYVTRSAGRTAATEQLRRSITCAVKWDAEDGASKSLAAAQVSVYGPNGESHFDVPLAARGIVTETAEKLIRDKAKEAVSKLALP
jgi:hypothetical protein